MLGPSLEQPDADLEWTSLHLPPGSQDEAPEPGLRLFEPTQGFKTKVLQRSANIHMPKMAVSCKHPFGSLFFRRAPEMKFVCVGLPAADKA